MKHIYKPLYKFSLSFEIGNDFMKASLVVKKTFLTMFMALVGFMYVSFISLCIENVYTLKKHIKQVHVCEIIELKIHSIQEKDPRYIGADLYTFFDNSKKVLPIFQQIVSDTKFYQNIPQLHCT